MLLLTVALEQEARPLIAYFKLKKKTGPFPLYEGEGITLIVTGIGRTNCLIAMGYLFGVLSDRAEFLINVGIAGHRSLAKGEVILAHKVTYDAHAFYPTLFFRSPCKTDHLFTVERPEIFYEKEGAYDQEAFFIAESSKRFLSQDRIHFLKIVSDNPLSPIGDITKERVNSLIESSLPFLEELKKEVFSSLPKNPSFQSPLDLGSLKLTFTESENAMKMMTRLYLLNRPRLEGIEAKNKGELFSHLKKALEESDLTLPLVKDSP